MKEHGMIRKGLLLTAALALGVCACSQSDKPTNDNLLPVTVTASFPYHGPDLANLDAVLDRPVNDHQGNGPLELINSAGNRQWLRTGREYLHLKNAGYGYTNNYDNMHESWFKSAAMPVALLKDARPSRVSYVADLSLTKDPLDWLPPDIGWDPVGSQVDAVDAADQPFIACWPKSTWLPERNGGIEIDDHEGGITQVDILARGDFNGDGVEDLLLSVNNYASEGSFKLYSMVIVTRLKPGAPLRVIRVWE
jgi:hypothetical protein